MPICSADEHVNRIAKATPVDSTSFDVLVVGGGPAGAACALALSRLGLRVLILDRTARDPSVGETLPPQVRLTFERLGIWQTFLNTGPLASPGVVSCWGSSNPQETD